MTPLLSQLAVQFSPPFGGGVLFMWIIAKFKKRRARQRLESQSGLNSVGELDWRDFEGLLSEPFRRQDRAARQVAVPQLLSLPCVPGHPQYDAKLARETLHGISHL